MQTITDLLLYLSLLRQVFIHYFSTITGLFSFLVGSIAERRNRGRLIWCSNKELRQMYKPSRWYHEYIISMGHIIGSIYCSQLSRQQGNTSRECTRSRLMVSNIFFYIFCFVWMSKPMGDASVRVGKVHQSNLFFSFFVFFFFRVELKLWSCSDHFNSLFSSQSHVISSCMDTRRWDITYFANNEYHSL